MKNVAAALSLMSLAVASCGPKNDREQAPAVAANAEDPMVMSGPFAEVETRMDEAMTAAVGTSLADSWVRKMIAHSRGAVEMSNVVLDQNPSAEVAKMARDIISRQTPEIASFEKLVAAGDPDPASAGRFRAPSATMRDAMMAANGADISETYLRKMIEHHRGAVAMADIALARGVTGLIRARAEKVRRDRQKDITITEAMLRGEPMRETTAMPTAAPTPKMTPTARPAPPRPTAAVKAAPSAAPKAKPAPSPSPSDPHAGMDMSKM